MPIGGWLACINCLPVSSNFSKANSKIPDPGYIAMVETLWYLVIGIVGTSLFGVYFPANYPGFRSNISASSFGRIFNMTL